MAYQSRSKLARTSRIFNIGKNYEYWFFIGNIEDFLINFFLYNSQIIFDNSINRDESEVQSIIIGNGIHLFDPEI